MSASYVAGYRIGMIVAGAGALYLAAGLGTTKEAYVYSSWQLTYLAMAATMLVGVLTTLLIDEPHRHWRIEFSQLNQRLPKVPDTVCLLRYQHHLFLPFAVDKC
jgi:hypothetical protein